MRSLGLTIVVLVALTASAGPARAQAPTTTLESRTSTGDVAGGQQGSVSADGRYVVFSSAANDIVPGDKNNAVDFFVRDRVTGQTQAVNVGPNGLPAGGTGDAAAISANGRYVAFANAPRPLGYDAKDYDLFVLDRTTGRLQRFAAPDDTDVFQVSIDADGGRIAYAVESFDSDQVYVADTTTGLDTEVSATPDGTEGDGDSLEPAISADGRWVAFTTYADNLVAGRTANTDVVVRDLTSGTISQVSLGAGNAQPNGSSSAPAVDGDGCVIAFQSAATNLVANDVGTGTSPKVFVRDRCAGNTERVSVTNAATNNQRTGTAPDISDDGCLVSFLSQDMYAAPPSEPAAVLRDRCAGTTTRLDLSSQGEPGGGAGELVLSGGTGRYAVFTSAANTLVAGDTNSVGDVFLRDRADHNVPPVAELTLTQDGHRVTADASASHDPDGPTVTGSIAFGDGSAPTNGINATHTYDHAGTYSVTATVTDGDGATATKTLPVTVTDPAPAPSPSPEPTASPTPTPTPTPAPGSGAALESASVSPKRFRVGKSAKVTVDLRAAATVTLSFQRQQRGHRHKGRCVAGAKHGKRCTRYAGDGKLSRSLPAGTSTIALSAHVGSRTLKPGHYRVKVASGSASRTLSITILKGH